MLKEHLKRRTIKNLSNVPVHLVERGSRHSLAFKINTELEAWQINSYPQLQVDMMQIFKDLVAKGDVMGALEYITPICGTEDVLALTVKIYAHIRNYKKENPNG